MKKSMYQNQKFNAMRSLIDTLLRFDIAKDDCRTWGFEQGIGTRMGEIIRRIECTEDQKKQMQCGDSSIL